MVLGPRHGSRVRGGPGVHGSGAQARIQGEREREEGRECLSRGRRRERGVKGFPSLVRAYCLLPCPLPLPPEQGQNTVPELEVKFRTVQLEHEFGRPYQVGSRKGGWRNLGTSGWEGQRRGVGESDVGRKEGASVMCSQASLQPLPPLPQPPQPPPLSLLSSSSVFRSGTTSTPAQPPTLTWRPSTCAGATWS